MFNFAAANSSCIILMALVLTMIEIKPSAALKTCPKRNSTDMHPSGVFHWQIDPVTSMQRTEGKHVKMTCNGVGYYPLNMIAPDVSMVWTHNGIVIASSKRVTIYGKSKDRNVCVNNVNLKISNLKVKDSGSYSCKVIREDTGETVLYENFSLLVKKQGVD